MVYEKATAQEEFAHWSRTYDRSLLQWLIFQPSHQALLEQVTVADRHLLDVGCGTGQFAPHLLQRYPDITYWGLDLSAQMLEQGRARFGAFPNRTIIVKGDSERLPFRSNAFDIVTCSHSFHHYPRQSDVVREMYRVLRPGGKLMLIDGCRDGWWGWLVFDVVVTWLEGEVHHCSAERLRQLFGQAGFEKVNQTNRGSLAPFMLTVGIADKTTEQETLPKAA
jgi:ubiquinone/menaquinone biosynthesis C-methylase UbiE